VAAYVFLWVHSEARSLTERSVSSRIRLAHSFRSKNVHQLDTRAHWAFNERLCFWMQPLGAFSGFNSWV